jgi:hypothetical protein
VIEVVHGLGDERLEWRARVFQALASLYAGEPVEPEVATRAIEVFERIGDTDGMAAAWSFRSTLAGETGDTSEAEAARQALHFAHEAGNRYIEARALITLSASLLLGPEAAPDGIVECERLLTEASGNLRAAAKVRSYLSALIAMRGDFERARAMADEGLAMLADLGLAQGEAVSRMVAAIFIELAAERLDVAEVELRGALAVLDRLGAKVFANSAISALAEVLSIAGKDAEAEQLARLTAETAVVDDYDAQVRWRRARARVLVHRDALEEAEALARQAVAVSAGTSDVCMQGDSLVTLAEVLTAADRSADAAGALRDAIARYDRKGNLVAAEKAARTLRALEAASPREA